MMNYVGSVSIIDRGDAPAKAVIDKNTRSIAQRVADETKQELTKVMDRVDNIYVSYEMSTQTMFENPRGSPNVEYIEDIKELEEIITDTVKKKKYQQQVTVFIVGFQDICAQKMQLLQQVNQFFLENSKLDEDEELAEDKPIIDLEEASTTVNESLNTAEELTKRLSDINQDIIDYLVNYANTKASNKNGLAGYEKGKKKLEKTLESAKNDLNSLSEKLLTLQAELEEKEEKFQQIIKQLEAKTQEATRYKTAAEVAKKSAQDNEKHTSSLQDEIQKRDEKIQELRSKLSRLEINLTESQFDTEMSKRRLDSTNVQTKEKLAKLQEEVVTKKMAIGDAEREMARMHRDELASLEKSHQQDVDELKHNHMEEISKLTDELDSTSTMLNRAEKNAQQANEEVDELRSKILEIQLNQPDPIEDQPLSESPSGKSIGELSVDEDNKESRPSTKETKSNKKSESRPTIKTAAKSPNRGKEKGKGKDYAETGVQDEGGDPNKATVDKDPSRQPTRQSKNLEPVVETGDQEFTDSFELDDENSWSTVPAGHVLGRFLQYRRLSVAKIHDLEEQLSVNMTKTHRKVNSLKMQFTEHKSKWENERKILIDQVEQAQRLQTDAEKEADAAMTQLEEFINEQEKLEDEEENKRQEIIKTMSRPGTVKRGMSGVDDKKPEKKISVGEKRVESPQEERLQSENSEQELKNLMQQTDDAKAQEKNARHQTGAISAPPSMEPKDEQVSKKSAGRAGTAEQNRLSRSSSKPLSSKSKSNLKSPQTQIPPSEPSESNLNRETSFVSSRTLLTAPTPGTHVSDFERPPSKGSFESVDTISVSVNAVPSRGGANTTDLIRPVSISSVRPVICATPPPTLCKETQTELTPPEIDLEPITGTNEEEIRLTSAKSRASLRNQFKNRLDETRNAVEERRIKTPIIPIPTQKSVDDELISDDDDDDDIDLPIPDDLKEEALQRDDTLDAGTSPPPVPKHSKRSSLASRQSLSEHPLVQQYLRAYTGVHNFKEALSRIMVDKDQMSASQILTDLDMVPFDKENKVVPQIETMTENIYYVLNELSQVINSVLQNDRGPVVSSLMMGMSRDTTQRNIREKSGFTSDLQPPTRGSERSASTKAESMISDSKYKELSEQYEKLLEKQNQMAGDTKRYEDQQRHNMVVMMEMQDTINQLQRELSALGKQGRRPVSEGASTSVTLTQQQQDSAIMFTRLDSERNAKIMKKAVNEEKLDPNKYKEAVVQMDDYVNLPAQRLAHLVRKYVHHCRMKEIEENVQHSKSLNENVFEILDKMESLQNQRAKRWADRMDEMGLERMRLANMLMETLDGIEQESGIFLIKPMFSYRGREAKDRFSAKTTRPLRPQRNLSPLRDSNSAYAPAPTPASNVRPYMKHSHGKGDTNVYTQSHDFSQPRREIKGPLEGDNTGLLGSSVNYVGIQPKATWSMNDSQPQGNLYSGTISNTPRILELDINRMMIGQNTISAHIGNPKPSNDRLVNATSNNLLSYMTVNRPTGPGSAGKSERPTSGSRGMDRSSTSPGTQSPSSKHVRLADIDVPTVIPNTQPLPPIGQTSNTPDRPSSSDLHIRTPTRIPSVDDIPASPPGSSLRQSPLDINGEIS